MSYICPNCNNTANGNYCSQCGQKKIIGKESFKDLFKTFGNIFFHYDGKFWKTLKQLLFHPGALTIAYTKGQRERYIMPITFYIYITAAYFIMHSIIPDKNVILLEDDHTTEVAKPGTWEAYFNKKLDMATHNAAEFKKRLYAQQSKIFFFMIPVLALLLKLAFIKNKNYNLADHTIFALHVQSFAFFVKLLDFLPTLKWIPLTAYVIPIVIIVSIYFITALRKVYAISWSKAILTCLWVAICYGFILFTVAMLSMSLIILLWY